MRHRLPLLLTPVRATPSVARATACQHQRLAAAANVSSRGPRHRAQTRSGAGHSPLGKGTPMPQRPEHRRPQALAQYLADDNVADICRQRACSKSWRSKWRSRYDATKATGAQQRSTRPQSHPTHTPEHAAQAVVSLHQTLCPSGTGGAAASIQALLQHGREPLPSRRTLYRMLRRSHTEVTAHGSHASLPVCPGVRGLTREHKLSPVHVCCSSPEPDPHWKAWNVYPAFDEDGTRAPRCFSVAENSALGCCTRHARGERTSRSVWCSHVGAPAWDITSAHVADGQRCWHPPGGKKAKSRPE